MTVVTGRHGFYTLTIHKKFKGIISTLLFDWLLYRLIEAVIQHRQIHFVKMKRAIRYIALFNDKESTALFVEINAIQTDIEVPYEVAVE